MKIIDLLEEKAILTERHTSFMHRLTVISKWNGFDGAKAQETYRGFLVDIKRFDEINDKLNQVMSKTIIKIGDRRISLATAMHYLEKDTRLSGMSFGVAGLGIPNQSNQDIDLNYYIIDRIANDVNSCIGAWSNGAIEDETVDSEKGRIIDANNLLENEEFYKYFNTDYHVRLEHAVKRAVVLTDVD